MITTRPQRLGVSAVDSPILRAKEQAKQETSNRQAALPNHRCENLKYNIDIKVSITQINRLTT
jgi:hypothetical protein